MTQTAPLRAGKVVEVLPSPNIPLASQLVFNGFYLVVPLLASHQRDNLALTGATFRHRARCRDILPAKACLCLGALRSSWETRLLATFSMEPSCHRPQRFILVGIRRTPRAQRGASSIVLRTSASNSQSSTCSKEFPT
jgi:hypothetical protein